MTKKYNYKKLANKVFKTFRKLADQTMLVDQNQDKVQVFDLALSRNGFAIYPETGEYSLFTTNIGWSERQPIFSQLEKATVCSESQVLTEMRFIEMLKSWASKTTS